VARYSLLSTWVLAAALDPVWETIYESSRWPEWWPGVTSARVLVPRGPDGVGGVTRFTFRSRLPYDLTFDMRSTLVERPRMMEGVSTGELAGRGRWRFFAAADVTAVVFEWEVETTARWMNVLAPIARPVFAWNHDHVMRGGGEGLARLLGVRLLAAG
jgi:hypothetical protein